MRTRLSRSKLSSTRPCEVTSMSSPMLPSDACDWRGPGLALGLGLGQGWGSGSGDLRGVVSHRRPLRLAPAPRHIRRGLGGAHAPAHVGQLALRL